MRKVPANQRIAPRKAIQTRVVFEDEYNEGFLYFLSTDISLSGIFIESNIRLQRGSKVFLKFALYEGETPLSITGQVTRITELHRGPGRRKKNQKMGIGIRFLGLKAVQIKQIEEFINS